MHLRYMKELQNQVPELLTEICTMKISVQCLAAIRKAGEVIGYSRKGMENNMENIRKPLYKSMGRTLLERCRFPCCKRRVIEIERRTLSIMSRAVRWQRCREGWDCFI